MREKNNLLDPISSVSHRRSSRSKRRSHPVRMMILLLALLVGMGAVKGYPHFYQDEAHFSQTGTSTHSQQNDPDSPKHSPEVEKLLESGEYYPPELLEMAESNPETLDFVKNYPALHDQEPFIDLSAEAQSEEIPLLLQWDTRWGYLSYGDGLMGYTGCGPTCLSMAALYLTWNPDATPKAIAQYAEENGYYAMGSGTSWTLISQGSSAFGLTAEELPLDETMMANALAADHPIICSMGPGAFTTTGHYILLTGYQDGMFTVNDPNSVERSGKRWSYDTISGQIKNLWAMS